MTILVHEIKRNKTSLIIWSSVVSFMLAICVLIYPQMAESMKEMNDMFANMGALSDAFGMASLDLGEFTDYFSIECGEMLGLGGALFAAIIGINALSKEEKDKSADFLLTHPISRVSVVTQKYISLLFQITILNLSAIISTLLCMFIIGERGDFTKLALIFISYFILQIEITSLCFGISAFLKGNGIGIGLGASIMFYFINLISNISSDIEFLKYFTPFAYTDGAYKKTRLY